MEKSLGPLIDEALAAWAEETTRALQQKLADRDMVISGGLRQSVNMELRKATPEGVASAVLLLNNYGRFRDMKRLEYTRPANFDAICAWVEKRGIRLFRFIPGYDPAKRKVNRLPTTSVAINRIAWGVAWARYVKGRHRRKQWLNKYFHGPLVGRLLDSLYERVSIFTVQIVEREIEGLPAESN